MAEKVYVSEKLSLSLSRPVPGPVSGQVIHKQVAFAGGVFKTDDADEQKFVEASQPFRDGLVWLETPASKLADAQAKAKAVRVKHRVALEEVEAADAEVRDLGGAKAAAPKAPAEAKV